jgi:ArsR family transcriptional regulator
MNPENLLAGTASLFLALGDKTRLRLLNLMRDREICVSSFTGTLGHSQPLISRHLAYLRNSGLVEARRDGKWMHYRVAAGLDENTNRLLAELFKWMENQEGLRLDRQNYQEAYPAALTPAVALSRPKKERIPRERQRAPKVEPVYEVAYEPAPHHNEIEDFLL